MDWHEVVAANIRLVQWAKRNGFSIPGTRGLARLWPLEWADK
jgi:hypothetical protein